jgi:hypothetical protein
LLRGGINDKAQVQIKALGLDVGDLIEEAES